MYATLRDIDGFQGAYELGQVGGNVKGEPRGTREQDITVRLRSPTFPATC